jgi:transcriptional regulator with XRE-family HTH domain
MHLAELLADAMREQHLSVEAVAYATGIRAPRIKAFAEDGTAGPIQPTSDELTELAKALRLPLGEVQTASRSVHTVGTARPGLPA